MSQTNTNDTESRTDGRSSKSKNFRIERFWSKKFFSKNHFSFSRSDVAQQKSERSDSFHLPNEVIVFTLESVENECPGMLPEEKVARKQNQRDNLRFHRCSVYFLKVLQENERAKLLKTSSANDFDPSATEKRLRFRLNDNCSVGNISDNLEGLEGISESAASTGNLSVTSSCDDLDKADPLFDNGSVSGRGEKKKNKNQKKKTP